MTVWKFAALGAICAFSHVCLAQTNQPIPPDPMGGGGVVSTNSVDVVDLRVEGVITSSDSKLNSVIVGGKAYRVGETIGGEWRAIRIGSTKAEFLNVKTGKRKTIAAEE